MKSGYPTLRETQDPNVWRLEVECEDSDLPLRKEVVIAFIEAIPDMRKSKSLFIFYDHHELYSRTKKTAKWTKERDMAYHLGRELKRDLSEWACAAWWKFFFGYAGDVPYSVKHWDDRQKEKEVGRTTEGPFRVQ